MLKKMAVRDDKSVAESQRHLSLSAVYCDTADTCGVRSVYGVTHAMIKTQCRGRDDAMRRTPALRCQLAAQRQQDVSFGLP